MRVLYIGRHFPDRDADPVKKLRRKKNRYLKFRGQAGFFRAALHARFDVKEADLSYCHRHGLRISQRFDAVIVCSKSDSSGEGRNTAEFTALDAIGDIPKALFISNPEADFMPGDACLDRFDVIFKREHFVDLDRYPIAYRNRDKIRLAWLACPLVPATRLNAARLEPRQFGREQPSDQFDYEVCFFGTQSDSLRPRAWAEVLNRGLAAAGGIQPHDIAPRVDPWVFRPAVKPEIYIDYIRRSRVNLALDGLGEFTHRHWELWMLCSFCLSSPSIRRLALPGGATENTHFVCFDDLDDMVDKIRFYSQRPHKRREIAQAGRRLYERTYDFKAYGDFVGSCLGGEHIASPQSSGDGGMSV